MSEVKRHGSGWAVDFYLDRSKNQRVRKRGFQTRLDAVAYVRKIKSRDVSPRRLSDLVAIWHNLHGQSLKDAKYRLSRTNAIVSRLGNPTVSDFTALDWAEYRAERLKTVTASTVNHEQRYLSAVLSELVRMGEIKNNPLAPVRQLKVAQSELSFLTLDQCRSLLDECRASSNPHCYPVALLCLSTGARWGEAQALTVSSLLPGKVTFHGGTTKTGQGRTVPVSSEVLSLIQDLGNDGPGRLFGSCRDAFRSAYKRTGFSTPQQLTHILRHTFASHYMMAGGDILALQRILGHGNISMTMRYAHLSPDHLSSAVQLNPIAQLGQY
jgi:integrase